ncbi:MAG TPA: arginine--tRNA ligase [Sphingomonadales bacterium]|nr:arginine--tRNA ligase [Sphingomonadales bacterium]
MTDILESALKDLQKAGTLPEKLDFKGVSIEPPRDPAHGDVATNAALMLAGKAGKKPPELAKTIAAALGQNPMITEAAVAGPGFINLRLAPDFWRGQLPEILSAKGSYASSMRGHGEKVNVEFVSANPTGPMHVGHVRGAVFGDALANLLAKVGYRVTREYYINDAGVQVEALARSAHLRYREALGETISEIPEGLYPGDYVIPLGRAFAKEFGAKFQKAPEKEWLGLFRDRAAAAMMELIRDDLAALGIRHDVFFSEKSLHDKKLIEQAIAHLQKLGVIYKGVLDPPKGMRLDDWEPRGQTLFKATQFGDDVDRPLAKSDGSYTYFAADIAYHYDKLKRGFRHLINVFGADHGGYVKRLKAVVAALSGGEADLDVRICQLVKLFRGGEPVKMSKRAGQFVTLREVVDEVGKDVVRFIMLTRKNDAPLDFDFQKVVEQTRENPIFYVQYAHARACSVFRKARDIDPAFDFDPGELAKADLARLKNEGELGLIRTLAAFPRAIEAAAEVHEPHRIAFYLFDLASQFHSHWNKGNDEPALRFVIKEESGLTRARLALVKACALVIAEGLNVLGIEPVEEMRG